MVRTCPQCHEALPPEAFYCTNPCWCKACYRVWYVVRSGGLVTKQCEACGASFDCTARSAKRRRFCGRVCKSQARKEQLRIERELSKPPRNCAHCGRGMPQAMRADARYCSAACNSAAHHQTRKASSRGAAKASRIDRAYIIARDRGRCHLCGRRPLGWRLTIDHVIPLALGGLHVAENLRVACLSCNTAKGSRARNEQLLLVG